MQKSVLFILAFICLLEFCDSSRRCEKAFQRAYRKRAEKFRKNALKNCMEKLDEDPKYIIKCIQVVNKDDARLEENCRKVPKGCTDPSTFTSFEGKKENLRENIVALILK